MTDKTTGGQHFPPYWRERTLAGIGAYGWKAGKFNHEQMRFLHAQAQAEGGTAKWNPLNCTYKFPWGSSDYNKIPVQDYAQPTMGVCAIVLTLTTSHNDDGTMKFRHLLAWLQDGDGTAEDFVKTDAGRAEVAEWGTDPDLLLACLKTTP